MRTIKIDGNNFCDLQGFYIEIEQKMTQGLNWKIGRNLDAFADILQGGFGVHDINEKYELQWLNSDKSKIELSTDYVLLLDIIKDNKNVNLKLS